MSLKLGSRFLIPGLAAVALVPAIAAAPAAARGGQTIKCAGNAYGCVAAVNIGGGASNKRITITLTDTDFARVGVRVTPGSSRGAFSISKASFRNGGSEYRFTLSAVRGNPSNARVILLFSAGRPA